MKKVHKVNTITGEIICTYASTVQASIAENVNRSLISRHLNHNCKTFKGENVTFRYDGELIEQRPVFLTHNCTCKKCGKSFSASTNKTICSDCRGKQMYERYKNARQQFIKKPNVSDRPLTQDTEFLVCLYSHRGESVRRIANDLDRNEKQIRKILREAKKSGRYEKHINKHLIHLASDIPQTAEKRSLYNEIL